MAVTQDQLFNMAHSFTALWEGGYIDHPSDPGGATNYGISLRFLREQGIDINGDGDIDAADVRALNVERAGIIYRQYFFDAIRAGELPPLVALVVYDGAVNIGPRRAVRHLQEVLVSQGQAVSVDGAIGPQTLQAAHALCPCNDTAQELALAVLGRRVGYYRELARTRAQLAVFLCGWLNRVEALRHSVVSANNRGLV